MDETLGVDIKSEGHSTRFSTGPTQPNSLDLQYRMRQSINRCERLRSLPAPDSLEDGLPNTYKFFSPLNQGFNVQRIAIE